MGKNYLSLSTHVIHQPRSQVRQRQLVQRLGRDASKIRSHDTSGIDSDSLEAIGRRRLTAVDALQAHLVQGGILGDMLQSLAGARGGGARD